MNLRLKLHVILVGTDDVLHLTRKEFVTAMMVLWESCAKKHAIFSNTEKNVILIANVYLATL